MSKPNVSRFIGDYLRIKFVTTNFEKEKVPSSVLLFTVIIKLDYAKLNPLFLKTLNYSKTIQRLVLFFCNLPRFIQT